MAASGAHDWIAKFYKAHPAPKPVEPAKDAAKNAAGGAAAGGATGAATGVKQGWGPEQWITFVIVLALVAAGIFIVSYWWKHRKKAEAAAPQIERPASAYDGLAAVAAALPSPPAKKPSTRRSVAKKANSKPKPKAKPKKRRA
jgi:cell division septation protein DedD